MKTALACAVLIAVVGTAMLQTAHEKREKVQDGILFEQVRMYAASKETPNPTATPPHCTMHVTQKIMTDPKMPERVLAVIGREYPDTINGKPVNRFSNNK